MIKLNYFLNNMFSNYSKHRDYPSLNSTSCLSAYLNFGHISPHQIINNLNNHNGSFFKELIWREFCNYISYHENLTKCTKNEPLNQKQLLFFEKWKSGNTGYPIIDAGMKELLQTGFMHNRIRMLTSSFLIKNLGIHWKFGEEWFLDNLYDADFSNNNLNWKLMSGLKSYSMPYFRVFNPIIQSKKFDLHANYIKKYLPELCSAPSECLHNPIEFNKFILQSGKKYNYPKAIVDFYESKKIYLKEFVKK